MKECLIVGTRPQFIKLYGYLKMFKPTNYEIIHTGQHYDYEMSKIFFNDLNIPKPNINLKVNENNMTFQLYFIYNGIKNYLKNKNISKIIVFGDCITTFAGALLAKDLNIELYHIEGCYRSNIYTFPEDFIRMFVDNISDVIYTYDKYAKNNAINEGISANKIKIIKNPMIIALEDTIKKIVNLKSKYNCQIILTLHRQDNVNKKIILNLFNTLSDIKHNILFPVHPRTKQIIKNINVPDNIKIIKPLNYSQFINELIHSKYIITDSGGIQQECNYLNKKCLLINKDTGRNYKTTTIIGTNFNKIINIIGGNKNENT